MSLALHNEGNCRNVLISWMKLTSGDKRIDCKLILSDKKIDNYVRKL